MVQLSDFNRVNLYKQPPGYQGGYDAHVVQGEDEARYILKPDTEFDRPWLASPQGKGGIAFVWPLGVEGFTFSSNATAGVHHYIGDNGVYVDMVYPDEYHLVLTGMFPGKTSVDQIPLLRSVILHQPDAGYKLLSMPPAAASIYYVQVMNYNFAHDQSDLTLGITYSIEFIRTDVGPLAKSKIKNPPSPNPTSSSVKGKSTRKYTVRGHARTIPAICKAVYGNSDTKSQLRLYNLNEKKLNKLGIPIYKMATALVPTGTVLYY